MIGCTIRCNPAVHKMYIPSRNCKKHEPPCLCIIYIIIGIAGVHGLLERMGQDIAWESTGRVICILRTRMEPVPSMWARRTTINQLEEWTIPSFFVELLAKLEQKSVCVFRQLIKRSKVLFVREINRLVFVLVEIDPSALPCSPFSNATLNLIFHKHHAQKASLEWCCTTVRTSAIISIEIAGPKNLSKRIPSSLRFMNQVTLIAFWMIGWRYIPLRSVYAPWGRLRAGSCHMNIAWVCSHHVSMMW